MRANRTDSNQTDLIEYFRSWGCTVLNISSLKNACDLVVARHGRTIMIEVKDGAKPKSARKLTEGEQKFKEEWAGAWRLCESIKDADKIINELNSTERIYVR